jgi:hypothetical protein
MGAIERAEHDGGAANDERSTMRTIHIRRGAMAATVAIAALAAGTATARAESASSDTSSYEQACPAWYGDLNPIVGCTPHWWLATVGLLNAAGSPTLP